MTRAAVIRAWLRRTARSLFAPIDRNRLRFRGGPFALPIYLVVVSMYPLSLQHADWVDIDEHFWWIALGAVLAGTIIGNGRMRFRRTALVAGALGAVFVVLATTYAAPGSTR